MEREQQMNLLFLMAIVALALAIYAVTRHETDEVEDGAITTAKLGNDAVTAAKIADNAVKAEHVDETGDFVMNKLTTGTIEKSSGISVNASDGAINVGNEANNYPVNVGTAGARKNTVGSSTGASQLKLRTGTDGVILGLPAPTADQDGASTITAAELLTGVISGNPGAAVAWTLDTAANLVAAIDGVAIGDCLDFTVINLGDADEPITVTGGTGGTTYVGSRVVEAPAIAGEENSGSGQFRIRFTGVASGSEAYTVYRIA